MESLTPEVAPFGIRTMLVEPGFFRTELLTNDSTTYAEPTIEDYAEQTKAIVVAWKGMDGKQGGDPAKLAHADRAARGNSRSRRPLRRRRGRSPGVRGQGPALTPRRRHTVIFPPPWLTTDSPLLAAGHNFTLVHTQIGSNERR